MKPPQDEILYKTCTNNNKARTYKTEE